MQVNPRSILPAFRTSFAKNSKLVYPTLTLSCSNGGSEPTRRPCTRHRRIMRRKTIANDTLLRQAPALRIPIDVVVTALESHRVEAQPVAGDSLHVELIDLVTVHGWSPMKVR